MSKGNQKSVKQIVSLVQEINYTSTDNTNLFQSLCYSNRILQN